MCLGPQGACAALYGVCHSQIGQELKVPNCLILDEIDEADARGAIASLELIIKVEMPSRSDSNSSRKKKQNPYLRRSIVVICNHKLALALRPLVPCAMQFDVSPPSRTRLVARLRAVMNEEHLNLTGTLLHQLVTRTGVDIRSCLYTSQLSAARGPESWRDCLTRIKLMSIFLVHRLEQQTIESLTMWLKRNCPFVAALNRLDR